MLLKPSYFQQKDVVHLAQDLIGKILYTRFQGIICAAIITEAEAYTGINDKASHAYNGKFTPRTKTMFEAGGIAYIYLIYGIHSLFNIVSNIEGIPHAVLIRGGFPILGMDHMKIRNRGKELDKHSLNGPGKFSKTMGLHYSQDGLYLEKSSGDNAIWIEDEGWNDKLKSGIDCGPRIGIDYAEEDALLPYRFLLSEKAAMKLNTLRTDWQTNQ